MVVLCAVFLYPFLYTVSMSLSDARSILSGEVYLLPKGLNLVAYRTLFMDQSIVRAFLFTLRLTVVGVVISLCMTTLLAYPLSRKDLRGGWAIMLLIVFTMYFSGGLIPYYILMKKLRLLNTMWVLVLPGVDTFLLIVMISYMRGIPKELQEAATVEGCGNTGVLLRIVVPLSVPIIATLTIFYSVGLWNMFYRAFIFMSDSRKATLQVKLYQVLNLMTDQMIQQSGNIDLYQRAIPENIKAATVVVAVGPIILVYPFLQRYFIKGITIGSLKG